MKGSLIIIFLMYGLVISYLVHVVEGQKLVQGNGNIRVTKTCGSGRRKSASELKEIERKSIEKALKKKRMNEVIKPELEPSHKFRTSDVYIYINIAVILKGIVQE